MTTGISTVLVISSSVRDYNNNKAKDLGISVQSIGQSLETLYGGKNITTFNKLGKKTAGIIAQELEKVLPEAVKEKRLALYDNKTYKTVEYDAIHGLLIQAIKELKNEIRELKS